MQRKINFFEILLIIGVFMGCVVIVSRKHYTSKSQKGSQKIKPPNKKPYLLIGLF